ncbi:MAG: site-specific DNA-methyltransferase [Pseudomonadota bacterium]|nr:site-specific DNA-methyltransferase [Pseudomonadota bacterium]
MQELDADGRVWWGENKDNVPRLKRFLSEVKQGVVPQTLWFYKDVGHTQEAKKELLETVSFADSASVFITPKLTRLMKRIIEIATEPGDIVLDSFAGSGTTGVAVAREGGGRRFIMIEMEPAICKAVTAPRLQRVIEGYDREKSNGSKDRVEGTGGGFRFCTLGEPLFDAGGNVSAAVTPLTLPRMSSFAIPARRSRSGRMARSSARFRAGRSISCLLRPRWAFRARRRAMS